MSERTPDSTRCRSNERHRAPNAQQRAAFAPYAAQQGRRSLERPYDQLQAAWSRHSLRTLYNWSRWFSWQAQIAELEAAVAAEEREQLVADYRAMCERHRRLGRAMQSAAARGLKTLPDPQRASDIVQLMRAGVVIEAAAQPRPPDKIDIERQVREMAIAEGLDPDQAVRDALEISRHIERAR